MAHKHKWKSPQSIVGGCDTNPGVWSDGRWMTFRECCMVCGDARVTVADITGETRDRVSYERGTYRAEVEARRS